VHSTACVERRAVHVKLFQLGALRHMLLDDAAARLHALADAACARVEVVERDVRARYGHWRVGRGVVEGEAQLHERCLHAVARLRGKEVDDTERAIGTCLESVVDGPEGSIRRAIADFEVEKGAVGKAADAAEPDHGRRRGASWDVSAALVAEVVGEDGGVVEVQVHFFQAGGGDLPARAVRGLRRLGR